MKNLYSYLLESDNHQWTREEVLKFLDKDPDFKALSREKGYKIKLHEWTSRKGETIKCIADSSGWDWEIRFMGGKIYVVTDRTYVTSHPQYISCLVDNDQPRSAKLKCAEISNIVWTYV